MTFALLCGASYVTKNFSDATTEEKEAAEKKISDARAAGITRALTACGTTECRDSITESGEYK